MTRQDIGGPVKSDVSRLRDTDYPIRFPAIPNKTCPQCGSGEIHHPFQTADLPTMLRCLRCNVMKPSEEFP